MTDVPSRWSNPLSAPNGRVGPGAVLYDIRDAERRPCCREGGRCLAHIVGVYEDTATDEVYFRVQDGTHTTEHWCHQGDLLALYEPAGWCVPTRVKPTYVLTRRHGVEDHHDVMTDGGRSESGLARCSECGKEHHRDEADEVPDGRKQIECACGNYIIECDSCGDWVSVMASVSGPDGKPVHRQPECGIEPMTDGGVDQGEAAVAQLRCDVRHEDWMDLSGSEFVDYVEGRRSFGFVFEHPAIGLHGLKFNPATGVLEAVTWERDEE